jgi:hypothetical protein
MDHLGSSQGTRAEWQVLLEGPDPFQLLPQATQMLLHYSGTVLMFANARTHKLLSSFPWHDLHDSKRAGQVVELLLFIHTDDDVDSEAVLRVQCVDEESAEQLVADLHYMTHSCGSKSGRVVKFKSLLQAAFMTQRLARVHKKDVYSVPHSEHATDMSLGVMADDLEKQDSAGLQHQEQLSKLTATLGDAPDEGNSAHDNWVFNYTKFPVHTFQKVG